MALFGAGASSCLCPGPAALLCGASDAGDTGHLLCPRHCVPEHAPQVSGRGLGDRALAILQSLCTTPHPTPNLPPPQTPSLSTCPKYLPRPPQISSPSQISPHPTPCLLAELFSWLLSALPRAPDFRLPPTEARLWLGGSEAQQEAILCGLLSASVGLRSTSSPQPGVGLCRDPRAHVGGLCLSASLS